MGMKVPAIVEETKKALEAGYCVVIGLQTTGEVLDLLVFNANFSSISAILYRGVKKFCKLISTSTRLRNKTYLFIKQVRY
jgi:hypothetical protein